MSRVNFCGGREIRTLGPVSRTLVFKTSAIDHSAIPPNNYVIVAVILPENAAYAKYAMLSPCAYWE